jgi:hypothetical protein
VTLFDRPLRPTPPPAAKRARSVGRFLKSSHVVLAALVGLATLLLSLLFQLAPGLKPDPGDNVGADVQVLTIEPHVTVGRWIDRAFDGASEDKMRARFGHEQLNFSGSVLLVRMAVDGHKHSDVVLRYRIFKAADQERVTADLGTGFALPTRIDIDAPSERSVQLMWLPDLSAETDDFFVRVELSDGDGLLAVANSPKIHKGLLPLA